MITSAEKKEHAADRHLEARGRKRSSDFVTASHRGDFAAQIRLAQPVARRVIVTDGIAHDVIRTIDDMVTSPFCCDRTDGDVDDMWQSYCDHVNAAFALGIALGQLVHHDIFKRDGGVR